MSCYVREVIGEIQSSSGANQRDYFEAFVLIGERKHNASHPKMHNFHPGAKLWAKPKYLTFQNLPKFAKALFGQKVV